MSPEDILNSKYLPRTNAQIQKASPKKIAATIAYHFMFSDIGEMGRNFDNLWENGRGEKISEEFTKLYNTMPQLRTVCLNNKYFSRAMLTSAYDEVMFSEIMVAAENAGIAGSESRFRHFIKNLLDVEIFIINKDNVGVLSANNKFTDQVDFICMNGQMVQINIKARAK